MIAHALLKELKWINFNIILFYECTVGGRSRASFEFPAECKIYSIIWGVKYCDV